VVGGPIYRISGIEELAEGPGELSACRIEDGEVEETRSSSWGGWNVLAGPGVETDVVMVTTCREEYSVLTVPLGNFEAQEVPVKAESSL
jgi:hypothetical protein